MHLFCEKREGEIVEVAEGGFARTDSPLLREGWAVVVRKMVVTLLGACDLSKQSYIK